tara:strand:- start:2430 stop:5216 length:2787 start_codon:yes stop_codon:yes gene_type:complete
MSVQLILYPQSYDGTFNSISSIANEFVVDGINFNTINASDSYDSPSGNPIFNALINQPPSQVNEWYRFRSTSSGTPTLPAETSGELLLESAATSSFSGVYQRLSNLVVGTTYEMVVDLDQVSAGGFVFLYAYNGTTQIGLNFFAASNYQSTLTWTAASANDIIFISYFNTVNDTIRITDISVSPQGLTPTEIFTDLEDGQVICDLYEDEDIPLSLSVDDFTNVAEKVQSYSKAFNLPATKRNNLIFDNIFEITRTDTGLNFNPYVKTQCVLKQDGFLLFEGYLRLIDITDKEGEISYNVNLYSEFIALADVLKDRTFSNLDFSELNHDYQKDNIKKSWRNTGTSMTFLNPSTSGFRDPYTTVRYPFVDWSHQIAVGGSNDPDADIGNPELLSLEAAFRPFINIRYLLDRIFAATPFSYESAFFDTDDFKKLYMDFNWGSENSPVETGNTQYNAAYWFDNGTGGLANVATTSFTNMFLNSDASIANISLSTLPPNYSISTNRITSTVVNESYEINYSYNIENTDSTARTIECQWLYNSTPINNSGVITIAAGATFIYFGNLTQIMTNVGDTLQAQFKSTVGGVVRQEQSATFLTADVTFQAGTVAITTNTILQTLRGETGQWDFLKGILTMFNLVSIPDKDNPNNILIEPYADVFINNTASGTTSDLSLASRGIAHDWTDKIDVAEMKLMPLTDLNKKTIFKFVEDDDDYAFNQYKSAIGNNFLYGSKLQDEVFFTVLSGEKEIVAEPFAATLVKPLMQQFPDFITPAIYARGDEGTWEGFENSPRIMYNNGTKTLSSNTFFMPSQNGFTSQNGNQFLQFSHLTDIPTSVTIPPAITDTVDYHFGQCQLMTGVGSSTPRNLFSLYWQPYYNELYNPDTRIMTIKVNLSAADINTFNFFDTVMIKNRQFRVNKIDYKPNDLATVEFILVP